MYNQMENLGVVTRSHLFYEGLKQMLGLSLDKVEWIDLMNKTLDHDRYIIVDGMDELIKSEVLSSIEGGIWGIVADQLSELEIQQLQGKGVKKILHFRSSEEEILKAVRADDRDDYFVSASFSKKNRDNHRLSNREKEVLQLISEEYTNHEIADKLFISTHTVISHRKNLIHKLGVRNTAGLIRRSMACGLII